MLEGKSRNNADHGQVRLEVGEERIKKKRQQVRTKKFDKSNFIFVLCYRVSSLIDIA